MTKKFKNSIEPFHESLIIDVKAIINNGINEAYDAVNYSVIQTYWNIGRRIIEEEQNGETRA